MSELNEAWALALAEAEARARAAGRKDISEYLALRNANDLTRQIAGDWLLEMFTVAAGEANRAGAAIKISREDAHRFKVGNASMVGVCLSLESGVRLLTVEMGWPRAPRDGFIRGGGLACANIKHRGMKSANADLKLVRSTSGAPSWIAEGKHGMETVAHELNEAEVRKHIALLIPDSQSPSKR